MARRTSNKKPLTPKMRVQKNHRGAYCRLGDSGVTYGVYLTKRSKKSYVYAFTAKKAWEFAAVRLKV